MGSHLLGLYYTHTTSSDNVKSLCDYLSYNGIIVCGGLYVVIYNGHIPLSQTQRFGQRYCTHQQQHPTGQPCIMPLAPKTYTGSRWPDTYET